MTEGPEEVESLFASLGFKSIFGVSTRGMGNMEILSLQKYRNYKEIRTADTAGDVDTEKTTD